MKRMIVLILGLLFASAVFAQAPPTAPPVQMFSFSASAVGYGGVKGMQGIMTAGSTVRLTEYLSIGADRTWNPDDSKQPTYNLGDANYGRELGDLLPENLKAKLLFDPTHWVVTFQASAGKVTAPGINRVAEAAAIYLTRPMSDHMQLTCGYRVLFPGHVLVHAPSVGISFTF